MKITDGKAELELRRAMRAAGDEVKRLCEALWLAAYTGAITYEVAAARIGEAQAAFEQKLALPAAVECSES